MLLVAACGGNSRREVSELGNGGSGTTLDVNTGGTGGDVGSSGTGGTGGDIGSSGTGGNATTSTGGTGGGTSASGGTGGDVSSSTGGLGGDCGTSGTGGSVNQCPSEAGAGELGTGGATSAGGRGGSGSGARDGSGANDGSEAGATAEATGGNGASGSGGTSPITSCTDQFDFLGTWTGNVLDFYFNPQAPATLELVADSKGNITGKFTVGTGDPPPPPEGADVAYPPGYWNRTTIDAINLVPPPWPGFPYTIQRGAGCDSVFRFSIASTEIWESWCELQTPVYTPDFGWSCTLQGGGDETQDTCTVDPNEGDPATYPPWKCAACGARGEGGVCQCDANGCTANSTATQTYDLTFALSDGDSILSGPDPDESCSECTVRLEKQ
ncbi:MAG TPA: hypothetical protein VMI54_21795 [Polyangiaceae bacterium]|nr:hypothetical protein [Polyangiaceae bacterium]